MPMSNDTIVWLHLSDWHQRGSDFDRSVVRDALIDDLRQRHQLSQALQRVDFIVFSGDLAFSGVKDEFDAASREFLTPVLEATQVPRDRVFLVPGNHDLDRRALELLPPLLKTLRDRATVSQWLISLTHRQALMQPMFEYAEFNRRFFGSDAPSEPAYGFTKQLNVRGTRVAIVGMNSAWMCGQKVEDGEVHDYGNLILGEPQFHDPIHHPDVRAADLRIAVLHHPSSWLSEIVQRSLVETSLRQAFHFMLRGHEHEAHLELPSGTSGNCAIISAGAAYDRREYPNGYNFVHLDLKNGQGTVYLRRYDIGRGFHKDTTVTGDVSPGLYTFRIPKWASPPPGQNGNSHDPVPAPPGPPRPPIRQEIGEILNGFIRRTSRSIKIVVLVFILSFLTWLLFYAKSFPLDRSDTGVVIGGWTGVVLIANWFLKHLHRPRAEK